MTDTSETDQIATDFSKILGDFVCDLYRTFPELQETADARVIAFLETVENKTMDDSSDATSAIRDHCKEVFPERFFDILYKNEEMFDGEAAEFLPGINFSHVWTMDGITDSIKSTIWKYLQLVLFSVVEHGTDAASFGDTAKLFEAIDEEELREKLEETMAQMKDAFVGMGEGEEMDDEGGTDGPQIPNADDIHSHLKGLLQGKIGSLAQEIAEETAADLDISEEDATDVQGVFQKLFKNPGKLMGLVKNVGTKLDTKIKSGDLKESELLEEATEIMGKMKDMPGMGNIQDMMKKMGMGDMMNQMMGGAGGGGGKNTRTASTKSVETQLANQLRQAKEKERRVEEMERRRAAKEAQKEAARHADVMATAQPDLTPEQMDALVFSMGETVERSTVADKPKKKKKKKKK
jgi:hypothetical protein